MADPLSGQRDAINKGYASALYWPDGPDAPVDAGQRFGLRSCHIEITRCHKVRKAGKLVWRAEFTRFAHRSGDPYLLSNSGITTDPRYAVRAQDDPNPGTLDVLKGEPPEPEGVPPHEVAELPSSIEAQQRYTLTQAEIRRDRAEQPIATRLDSVLQQARQGQVDVSSDIRVIERRIAAVESKVPAAAKSVR